jgi:hypothetical protein
MSPPDERCAAAAIIAFRFGSVNQSCPRGHRDLTVSRHTARISAWARYRGKSPEATLRPATAKRSVRAVESPGFPVDDQPTGSASSRSHGSSRRAAWAMLILPR